MIYVEEFFNGLLYSINVLSLKAMWGGISFEINRRVVTLIRSTRVS